MKIVTENSTGRAVLMFEDSVEIQLTETGLTTDELIVSDIFSTTHTVVSGEPPEPALYWVAGALSYSNGVWAVLDQTVYDKASPQAKLVYEQRLQQKLEHLITVVIEKTQQRLDIFAKTRGYDGILSACTYVNSSISKFAVEGAYAVTARETTWATLYNLLDEVKAGIRTIPDSYTDVEPHLPQLSWPSV